MATTLLLITQHSKDLHISPEYVPCWRFLDCRSLFATHRAYFLHMPLLTSILTQAQCSSPHALHSVKITLTIKCALPSSIRVYRTGYGCAWRTCTMMPVCLASPPTGQLACIAAIRHAYPGLQSLRFRGDRIRPLAIGAIIPLRLVPD
ncbi:hypothetical protein MPH_01295 [Macrophomina phaseolina MS6]|uniref:Uncharacterized protein n=1 Tax=Macrophomina phaseolina (strain MS6) TaxID=1126212 RepID=K2S2V7_MACPH|nr:hypothetical protein MPH_01295 [Macrophomina phaseolina MS6]